MTSATQVIEAYKKLPTDEQSRVADFMLSQQADTAYELSTTEVAEVRRRLDANEETVPAAEVFAKFGS